MSEKYRKAAVQGRFYDNQAAAVFQLIEQIAKENRYPVLPDTKEKIFGAVLPHAGHIFSAAQTLPFFRYLTDHKVMPDTFVILHPNHRGYGPEIALDSHLYWTNCIGDVNVDQELSKLLPYPKDKSAHQYEHSAEVLIPFLQYYFKNHHFEILPLCLQRLTSLQAIKLGSDLHQAIQSSTKSVMLIASSDFSHFLSPEAGRAKDNLLLDQMKRRNIQELEKTAIKNQLTVCGYSAIMTLMAFSELSEPEYESTILARGHSGEVFESNEVVDYISVLFHSQH